MVPRNLTFGELEDAGQGKFGEQITQTSYMVIPTILTASNEFAFNISSPRQSGLYRQSNRERTTQWELLWFKEYIFESIPPLCHTNASRLISSSETYRQQKAVEGQRTAADNMDICVLSYSRHCWQPSLLCIHHITRGIGMASKSLLGDMTNTSRN